MRRHPAATADGARGLKEGHMTKRFVLAAVFVAGAVTPALASPPDREGRPSPFADRDSVPTAGYVRAAYSAHLRRRAAERSLLMSAPGQPLSIRGGRAIPIVCMKFANSPATDPFPTTSYAEALFGEQNPRSMSRYFFAISKGAFTVSGRVLGWYRAPKNDAYYEAGTNGNSPRLRELLDAGLAAADAEIDFGTFDNDGPDGRPNSGDDDGKVDTVFFVHPERGGECREPNGNIWSHSFQYSKWLGTGPYATSDVRRDRHGHPILRNGAPVRIVVEDYTIQPGLSCDPKIDRIVEIGVFCHEYGHALGLPDLYDRTPKPDPDSHGVGNWCVMAGGAYGGDGQTPDLPCHMSAWCKYYLGWASVTPLEAGPAELTPVAQTNDVYRIDVPRSQGLEYFLFEYRAKSLAGASPNWDERLPVGGLAIWHVDERVGSRSSTWPFADPNKGQNDSPRRLSGSSPPRFLPGHPLVYLIQADGQRHLDERPGNSGDAGDLFTTGSFGDDPTGSAGSLNYAGDATGIALSNIRVTLDFVGCDVTAPDAPRLSTPTASPDEARPLSGETRGVIEHVFERTPKAVLERGDRVALDTFARTLTAEEKATLLRVRPVDIAGFADPFETKAYSQLSSVLRTHTLTTASLTSGTVAPEVLDLMNACVSCDKLTVRYAGSAGSDRVTQLEGLSFPATYPTLQEDANARLNDPVVRRTLGVDLRLESRTRDLQAGTQYFRQVARVGDQTLPVLGYGVELHYDGDRRLVAVSSDVVRTSSMSIVGLDSTLDAEGALKAAQEALALPPEAFGPAVKGLWVPRDDEAKTARVAYVTTVNMGDDMEPLRIFVDADVRKVLEIR
jgi:M6 family metalloprotease-like protein